jgi:hypothetical protein
MSRSPLGRLARVFFMGVAQIIATKCKIVYTSVDRFG